MVPAKKVFNLMMMISDFKCVPSNIKLRLL